MDFINRNRWLVASIWLLLVLNFAALGALLYQARSPLPDPEGRHGGNGEGQLQRLLARELHLTDEQQQKLRQQNRAMHRRSRELERQVHELRRDLLLENLKSGQGNAQARALKEDLIALNRRQIELREQQLHDLRALLNPDQIERLQELITELAERRLRPPSRLR
jgi:Spy/CpxP family protein refolding chaperone